MVAGDIRKSDPATGLSRALESREDGFDRYRWGTATCIGGVSGCGLRSFRVSSSSGLPSAICFNTLFLSSLRAISRLPRVALGILWFEKDDVEDDDDDDEEEKESF